MKGLGHTAPEAIATMVCAKWGFMLWYPNPIHIPIPATGRSARPKITMEPPPSLLMSWIIAGRALACLETLVPILAGHHPQHGYEAGSRSTGLGRREGELQSYRSLLRMIWLRLTSALAAFHLPHPDHEMHECTSKEGEP